MRKEMCIFTRRSAPRLDKARAEDANTRLLSRHFLIALHCGKHADGKDTDKYHIAGPFLPMADDNLVGAIPSSALDEVSC